MRTPIAVDAVLTAWADEVSTQIRREDANRRHPLRRGVGLPYRAVRLYVRKSREVGTARATGIVVGAVRSKVLHG